MALMTDEKANGLYIRVENPKVHCKFDLTFFLVQYIDHPITSEMMEVGREEMTCGYSLDGPNVFEQCYDHAKIELPFNTFDC